jgi:methylated-DNA-protein-cysteine methyltransferase-like protein
VYEIVRIIPKGKVTSYGAIAEKIGARTTARMIGWAMNASHTVLPKIPAHRVVNRNGLLTGRHHFATPTLMQELLEAEGIKITEHQIVNFKSHLWLPE